MERLARALSSILLLLSLLALGSHLHPAADAMAWMVRWPTLLFLLLLGGWSFAHGVAAGAVRCLVAMAVLFAPWVHHVATRAALEDARGNTVVRVMVYALDGAPGDMALAMEALRARPAELLLLQGVTEPAWKAILAESSTQGMSHARVGSAAAGVAILARGRVTDVVEVTDPHAFGVGACARVALASGPLAACSVQLQPPAWRDGVVETARHLWRNAEDRANAVRAVRDALDGYAGLPRVWGGDMATLEWDGLHARTRAWAVDAFRDAHPLAPGGTWPAVTRDLPFSPWRRDMLWLSGAWTVRDADVLPLTASAHHPLHVTLLR